MERINVGAPFVGIRRTTVPERKNGGITLIALIITIIVMLILAGIVLTLTIGENGIIKRTIFASEQTKKAEYIEKVELAKADVAMNNSGEVTLDNLIKQIYEDKIVPVGNITKAEDEKSATMITKEGYMFLITTDTVEYVGKGEQIAKEQEAKLEIASQSEGKATLKITAGLPNDTIQKIDILCGEEVTTSIPVGVGKTYQEKEIFIPFYKDNVTYKAKIVGSINTIETNEISVEKNTNYIAQAKDLKKLSEMVNAGETFEGQTIQLTANIDLRSVCYKEDGTPENDVSWEPIGTRTVDVIGKTFSGTFNGNYHKIQNLYINTAQETSQGLFGYTLNAKIENLIMDNTCSINTTNGYSSGVIVGWANNSEIKNCANYGIITGGNIAGGICGILHEHSKILASFNEGKVTGEVCVGGIVGDLWNETKKDAIEPNVQYCYNIGEITATGGNTAGICGYNEGCSLISKCYNTGNVTGEQFVGGVVGFNRDKLSTTATVEYCCNIGDILGSKTYVGGICGTNYDNCYVKNCYNDSQATVKLNNISATNDIDTSSNYVGKIVGHNNGSVSGVGELSQTVYYIVNGNSNEDSQYWSKDNVNEPKLKWETNIK